MSKVIKNDHFEMQIKATDYGVLARMVQCNLEVFNNENSPVIVEAIESFFKCVERVDIDRMCSEYMPQRDSGTFETIYNFVLEMNGQLRNYMIDGCRFAVTPLAYYRDSLEIEFIGKNAVFPMGIEIWAEKSCGDFNGIIMHIDIK